MTKIYHIKWLTVYCYTRKLILLCSPLQFHVQIKHCTSIYRIQLRGFRKRGLGALFHKMNNDLVTINRCEPCERFVLAQGTHQATNAHFVLLA